MDTEELFETTLALKMQGKDVGEAGEKIISMNKDLAENTIAYWQEQLKRQEQEQKKAA